MKVRLQSTTKIVDVEVNGAVVPARIWEGETDSGIPVHAFITRIGVDREQDTRQFEAELQECATPSAPIQALPGRLVW